MAGSGASVALVARRPEGLAQERQRAEAITLGPVHVVVCDVSRADELEHAHRNIVASPGPVDILVNNAGTSQTSAFASITDAV